MLRIANIFALLVLVAAPSALAQSPGNTLAESGQRADASEAEPAPASTENKSLLDVWNDEHKWVRLGMRFYGFNPAVEDTQAFKLGAGLSVPITTDFFMGLGMKLGLTASYNNGTGCIRRADPSAGLACDSGQGTLGGVQISYKAPTLPDGSIDGSDPNAQPSDSQFVNYRRESHAAMFALTIGGNYELTIPTVPFLRVFQPFFGGGVMIAWVYTWPDLEIQDFVLLNNDENDALDSSNVDPWSNQGPEVGGEVYGGFHVNLSDAFRLTVELGYYNVLVQPAELNKATDGYDAQHLAYRLSQFRFGGGFEFRF